MHTTLHVWRVPGPRLPSALWRLARDRARLRRTPGVCFGKLLGTGRGRAFGPTAADPTRWAALLVWESADAAARFDTTPVARSWRRLAHGYCRLDLTPIASRGAWAGADPFAPAEATGTDGLVLALTRARLRPLRAVRFWRAIAPVARAIVDAPGLITTFGIGEAPIGWQGTISLWQCPQDLVEFAYRHPEHRRAIARTPAARWYAEELFARFAVLDITGDRGVLGWRADVDDQAERRGTPG